MRSPAMTEQGPASLPEQRLPTPAEAGPGKVTRGAFGVDGSGDTSGFGGLVRRPWTPPAAERPYGDWFDDVADALAEAYPSFQDGVTKVVVDRGEITFHV